MRCMTSGRLTPAAATLTRISPAPGMRHRPRLGRPAPPVRRACLKPMTVMRARGARSSFRPLIRCKIEQQRQCLGPVPLCDNRCVAAVIFGRRRARNARDRPGRSAEEKDRHEIGQDLRCSRSGNSPSGSAAQGRDRAARSGNGEKARLASRRRTIFQEMSAPAASAGTATPGSTSRLMRKKISQLSAIFLTFR